MCMFQCHSGTFEDDTTCLDLSSEGMDVSGNELSLWHATICRLHENFLQIAPNNISETEDGLKYAVFHKV